jgi:hypothetical protein
MGSDFSTNHVGIRPNQIPFWPGLEADPSLNGRPHVTHNGGGNEWYTPPAILAVAHKVLGPIDLDPASTPQANMQVQARRFFTLADNGLHQPWHGKVWLNPPYGTGVIEPFLRKLRYHVETGDVPEALVLVNNATETQWFHDLVPVASAICFPLTRIKYLRPDEGPKSRPIQGQALLYCGPAPECFAWHCRPLGHVWLALPGHARALPCLSRCRSLPMPPRPTPPDRRPGAGRARGGTAADWGDV